MKALLLLLALAGAVPPGHEPASYPGVGAAVMPPSAREASVLRTQAIDHFRQGLYREAARLYRIEASTSPSDPDAWRDAMWAHWYAGQNARAAEAGHELMALLPRDLEAVNLTAKAHHYAGAREEALKDYLRSLELDATQVAPRRAVSRLYEWFRYYRRAIRYAEWTLEAAPDDAGSHALIGRARFFLGEYGKSAEAWRRAVDQAPRSRDFRLSWAQALYFAGQEERSLTIVRSLLEDDDRYWAAVDFYVNVMLVRRDFGAAALALERSLRRITPQDEPRLMFLARLYAQQGRTEAFIQTVDAALELNPDNGGALLARAAFSASEGRGEEAARYYERLLDLNPGSEQAWVGLADSLAISSRPAQALEAIERARGLDPTDPHLIVLQSRYLFDAGRRAESKELLLGWLAENQDTVLPVLLYHGVTPFPRDTSLARAVNVTTATFDDHMRALADKGYQAVTAEMAAAWFRRELELPKNPVMVTFDGGRLDSVRHADPILRKHGFRATMYAPLGKLDANDHSFLSWNDLVRMRKTRRWDVQSSGVNLHEYVELDEEGRSGLAVSNRKRGESEDGFIARLRADHESAKARLEEKVGRLPSTYAFPGGDFGQLGAPNFPYSAELNLKLCRQSYSVCFHQDRAGVNVRTRDPALATRLEAKQELKGSDLVELIGDEDPRVLVRRQLIARAIYDRRAREALRWLRENQLSGASDALNLADEARIRWAFGDRPRGVGMARAALALDEEPEYRRLKEELERKMRPGLQPSARYVVDNQNRRHFTADTVVGGWVAGYSLLRPLLSYGRWREAGFPAVTGQGAGVEAARHLSLFHVLTVRGVGYRLPDSARRPFAASAALRSSWADPYFTELEAGAAHMLTARAVEAGVSERYGAFSAGRAAADSWEARLGLRAGLLSDDNARLRGTARLSKPVSDLEGLRAVYLLTVEGARARSARYYSPQRLVTNQLGLSYQPELGDELGLELTYLPGYGMESGARREEGLPDASRRVVHTFTASMTARWKDLTAKPLLTLSRSPLFRSNTYGLNLGWQF